MRVADSKSLAGAFLLQPLSTHHRPHPAAKVTGATLVIAKLGEPMARRRAVGFLIVNRRANLAVTRNRFLAVTTKLCHT